MQAAFPCTSVIYLTHSIVHGKQLQINICLLKIHAPSQLEIIPPVFSTISIQIKLRRKIHWSIVSFCYIFIFHYLCNITFILLF